MKSSKPLISTVAADLRNESAKRPKQYIVSVAGRHAGVTFTPAEEKRVRRKAAALGFTVTALIEATILKRLSRSRRPVDEVIVDAVKALAAPPKKKKRKASK